MVKKEGLPPEINLEKHFRELAEMINEREEKKMEETCKHGIELPEVLIKQFLKQVEEICLKDLAEGRDTGNAQDQVDQAILSIKTGGVH